MGLQIDRGINTPKLSSKPTFMASHTVNKSQNFLIGKKYFVYFECDPVVPTSERWKVCSEINFKIEMEGLFRNYFLNSQKKGNFMSYLQFNIQAPRSSGRPATTV